MGFNIKRLSLIEGARQARGLAVIIDVFRAFTTAAYIFANGARRIYPVKTIEEAFRLREINPELILIGEIEGNQIPGFDYGNSPADVSEIDFTGETIIQRTSAGTQGILNAQRADTIILGSFVMADSIASYISKKNPNIVSLVAMGWSGKTPSIEDEMLAEYLEKRLRGENPDFNHMKQKIRSDPAGIKFFDTEQHQFKEKDFHMAMDLNRFSFVLKVIQNKRLYVQKLDK